MPHTLSMLALVAVVLCANPNRTARPSDMPRTLCPLQQNTMCCFFKSRAPHVLSATPAHSSEKPTNELAENRCDETRCPHNMKPRRQYSDSIVLAPVASLHSWFDVDHGDRQTHFACKRHLVQAGAVIRASFHWSNATACSSWIWCCTHIRTVQWSCRRLFWLQTWTLSFRVRL